MRVALLESEGVVARPVGQKVGSEQAGFVAVQVKFIEAGVVLVGGHGGERRSHSALAQNAFVLIEAFVELLLSRHHALQVSEGGFGVACV